MAHHFNGFINASQLALSQRSGLGNSCRVFRQDEKIQNKRSPPRHPRWVEDLEVMEGMEGGEFFDRAAEVMSHSLWHLEHPKGGFDNSLPRKRLT